MKKLILLFALLLFAVPASATIAFVSPAWSGEKPSSGVTLGPITVAYTAGNDVVVVVTTPVTTISVVTIVDNGVPSSTYTFQVAINNGTGERVELWEARNVQAATTLTVTMSGTGNSTACIAQYSGVNALGITTTNTGNSTTPTINLTTQDANNFVVAGFAESSTSAYSANVGNLRVSDTNRTGAGALNDNTAASATAVTNTVTLAVSHTWAAVALELRSGGAAAAGGAQAKSRKLEMMDPQRR